MLQKHRCNLGERAVLTSRLRRIGCEHRLCCWQCRASARLSASQWALLIVGSGRACFNDRYSASLQFGCRHHARCQAACCRNPWSWRAVRASAPHMGQYADAGALLGNVASWLRTQSACGLAGTLCDKHFSLGGRSSIRAVLAAAQCLSHVLHFLTCVGDTADSCVNVFS